MNYNNTRWSFEDGILIATHTLRDPDDPDDDGTPVWKASTPAAGIDDHYAIKRLKRDLVRLHDNWFNHEKYV